VTAYSYGLKVLEGALAIGRQADTLGVDEVTTRFEQVQSRASSATSVADSYAAAGGCVLIGSFAGNKPPTGTSQWGQGPFFTEAMLRWLSRAQEPVAYR
jgi:hypothetical protein